MLIEDLFRAYFGARKNKRNTINALQFEYDFERRLFELQEELSTRTYSPMPSICFVNQYPVKREVFAADFRDRVVHHLIYNYIYHICERLFIYDSYSCRPKKGTLLGIKRLDHHIRSCSQNYQKDCYILKLDISGYFMNLDKAILYRILENIAANYRKEIEREEIDLSFLLFLIRRVIFDDPTRHCRIKGRKSDWQDLPKDKSLFYSAPGTGLPIGNLTSQLFSNVYLNAFDHYVKYHLGCKHYGRYVDDFFVVSRDKYFLKGLVPKLDKYLYDTRGLRIHSKKVYLQHFKRGVGFLGAFIKPHRIYVQNHIKGKMYAVINEWNKRITHHPGSINLTEAETFVARINSYLGMTRHIQGKKLRKSILQALDARSFEWFYVNDSSVGYLAVYQHLKKQFTSE